MKNSRLLAVLLLAPALSACPLADSLTGSGGSCTGPESYAAGTTLTGATGSNMCKGPDGSRGRLYTMVLTQQTNLAITVTPSGFPAHLGLYTAANDIVNQTNDGKMFAFLPAGSYQVFVGSLSNADGSFTLSSAPTSLSNCNTTIGGFTTRGAVISGVLDTSDCGNTLAKGEGYAVYVKEGTSLAVTFTSDRVAGFFAVNQAGSTLASKEQPAAGSWSTNITATTAGYYGFRLESRTTSTGNNLPVNYTISIN